MESKGDNYHQKVREGFLKLADGREDFIVIDATEPAEKVHQELIDGLIHSLTTDEHE